MSARIDDLDAFAEIPQDSLEDVIGGNIQSMAPACAYVSSSLSGGRSDPFDILV